MKPTEIIFEVSEAAEVGYDAWALGQSISTQGKDWNHLKAMARDAMLCHFEEDKVPRVIRLHLVRKEAIAVAVGGKGSRPVETSRERNRRIIGRSVRGCPHHAERLHFVRQCTARGAVRTTCGSLTPPC